MSKMIKLYVENMSCGHCQIKIKSELESHNYDVIDINMAENSVLVDTDKAHISALIQHLDHINYVLDENHPYDVLQSYTIWDDALDNDKNCETFTSFLQNEHIDITGFDDENIGLIVVATPDQERLIDAYIKTQF